MKLYDLTQELFSAEVFPGDPIPAQEQVLSIEEGDPCQLTELTIGSHSGTHMDAPAHFLADGKGMDELDISKCLGPCKVVTAKGSLSAELVGTWLSDGTKKLLIKGDIVITEEAARKMVEQSLECVGVEGMTVGPFSSPAAVHRILLGNETVIIESLRMADVPDGSYWLSALPLKMRGLDGSPVRAVVWEMEA